MCENGHVFVLLLRQVSGDGHVSVTAGVRAMFQKLFLAVPGSLRRAEPERN